MTGATIAMLAALAAALVLPVMALRDRRIAWGKAWRMAAIWIALFVLAAMVFAWLGM